jgi:hypothetical protein
MPPTLTFTSGHVLNVVACFAFISGCGGRVTSGGDDRCASCQFGTGDAPVCQADNVATAQYGADGVSVAGSSVSWSNFGRAKPGESSVMKAELGGAEPVALVTNQQDVRTVAVDAQAVYWASGDIYQAQDIFRVDRDGGAPILLAHAGRVEQLVAHGSWLYWTEGDAVRRVPTAGGEVKTLADGQTSARGLVVDDSHVYWSDWGSDDNAGGVFRVPIDGGDREVIVATPGFQPWALASNETTLFIASSSANGSIWKVPKGATGDTGEAVATDVQPWTLAADASHLYWAVAFGLRSKELATGAVTHIDTPTPPFNIGIDAERVVWTSIGDGDDNTRVHDGSVWTMCKPR